MSELFARVRLSWLSPEQGGRRAPFVGSRYAPTARFTGDELQDMFSVVIEFDQADSPNPSEASLGLLDPGLTDVRLRIRTGATLEIMEGPRKVADCSVLSTEHLATAPAHRDH
jgi:hypothetical protein